MRRPRPQSAMSAQRRLRPLPGRAQGVENGILRSTAGNRTFRDETCAESSAGSAYYSPVAVPKKLAQFSVSMSTLIGDP
jgi:hypothetical protein